MKRILSMVTAGTLLISIFFSVIFSSISNIFIKDTPIIEAPSPEQPILPEQPIPEIQFPPITPILPEQPIIPVPEEKAKDVYVKAKVNGLNIRTQPKTSASSLGYIDKNDMLSYKETKGGWHVVEYKNKTAYISAGNSYTILFDIEKSENEKIESVINEGYKLLGYPYVYGATRYHNGNGKLLSGFNKTKYDCSSLMQYIFYHGAGINLNLTTRTQIKQGKHVSKSDIQRGDLIFFTNSDRYYNSGIERVGHVALYLGDNYILHTASDYAVIEEISSKRWSYYIETRRMI